MGGAGVVGLHHENLAVKRLGLGQSSSLMMLESDFKDLRDGRHALRGFCRRLPQCFCLPETPSLAVLHRQFAGLWIRDRGHGWGKSKAEQDTSRSANAMPVAIATSE
jgi:hypothetical protein